MTDLLKLLLDTTTHGASTVGEVLEGPDSEWAPILICANDEHLNVVGLPRELFHDKRSKMLLAEIVIPSIAEEFGATGLSFMTAAFSVPADPEGGPIEGAERTEILSVVAVTRGHMGVQTGLVTRHSDQPPTVEWEDPIIDPVDGDVDGLFPDALRRAVEGVSV